MPDANLTANRRALRRLPGVLGGAFAAAALVCLPAHAELAIGNNPLYLVLGKANVLMILDNSNSMDESPLGAAVGSNSPNSKSEIARGVIRSLTDNNTGRVNMGLMTYRQNASLEANHIHNSPYDVSYNPADYDPGWTGSRVSATRKRFRIPNPTSPGNFVHYNVALPFYSSDNAGNSFCYSPTSVPFDNGGVPNAGWDTYRCYASKTGTDNTLPTWGNAASEAARGYSGWRFQSTFWSTDSDFAQGITDFGRQIMWQWVGPAWFTNTSPGRGFLDVPLADLGNAQAAAIKAKLACNVPGLPGACTAAGVRNAGLTPIEGTLLTARDYYKGTWTTAAEGYVASCYPLPQSCGKNFVVLLTDGLPSTNRSGATLSNPAVALNEAAAAAALLKADGIDTYVIGFALPFGTDPTSLDKIAASGGTGTAYNAADQASLQAAFDAIFSDIFRKTSAFSSAAQNSTSINTGSLVFQGRFDSTDWSGEVVALRPQTNGTLSAVWNSADNGRIPPPADRKVFTLVPGSGGREFKTLADLGASQQAALAAPNCSSTLTGATCAQARIDWMRGARTLEDPAGALRRRWRLFGDVISSSPYYVKATNTLFVGANDGMMHAIDASNGNERFTFVPNALFGKLSKLTSTTYAHDYYVDGEIAVSGAYETPGKNILVGALGRGGKALYALDVTDPANFTASKVMWEFTDPDLGLVLGKPVIAKLNSGQTAVIVGNGYNSSNERAFLFIIDINTGALIRKIDTGAGSAAATNGMATPRGWDHDGNGTVDTLYAGDLLGNLWKFNLSSATAANWASSYTTSGSPTPMFVAVDNAGSRQPITGMVGVGINGNSGDPNFGKRYIFFGTGRYLVTSDVTNTAAQSWYGLIDDSTAISGRSQLRQRTIEIEGSGAMAGTRAFSVATAGDMSNKRGWYIDLVSPNTGTLGERMVGENKFFGNVLLASSMIPSTNPCTPGGQGYVNAVDPFTGAALSSSFFDRNNDLVFNDSDRLGSDKRAIGSVSPGINMPSDAILIGNLLAVSGTSGQLSGLSARIPIRNGRITWREVVNQ